MDLQTTQEFNAEQLNTIRLRSMIDNLQAQRENALNEVINARAEVAMMQAKLASEIQVSRSMQASVAAERNVGKDALARVAELEHQMQHFREDASAIENALRNELAALRETLANSIPATAFVEVGHTSGLVAVDNTSLTMTTAQISALETVGIMGQETIQTSGVVAPTTSAAELH